MSLLNSNGQLEQHKPSKSELGYGDYLRFRALVLESSGLHFPEKKKSDLEVGLFKALAASPVASSEGYNLDAYYNLLRDSANPVGRTEMSRLINTLTVGETHFFRDEAQFNALADHVLPALIAHKRASAMAIGPDIHPQLRIWSAGCASGEEPYSLAILLKELLPDIESWSILILATDVNQDSLARAHEACYSDWSFREARAKALRPRYFTTEPTDQASGYPRGQRYRLHPEICRMVTFASLNLITDPFPSIYNNTASLDLIICRNVTIYFAEETTREVVNRFYEALVEGGWLVVGHSEPSLVIYRAFQVRNFPDTLLYQKTGQPAKWPEDWEWLARAGSEPVQPDGNKEDPAAEFKQDGSRNGRLITGETASTPEKQKLHLPTIPAAHEDGSTARQVSRHKAELSRDSYELAVTLLDTGRIKEAIDELQRMLAVTPNFAPAHSLLGRAYANMGRWAESQQWCQSAVKLDSLLAEPYYVLALVYEHEGQFQPAISMLKKAIYLDRDMPLAHFSLAMLYKKAGETRQARRAFENSIKVLEKWPPAAVVPDSGGATARQLLMIAQRILGKLTG